MFDLDKFRLYVFTNGVFSHLKVTKNKSIKGGKLVRVVVGVANKKPLLRTMVEMTMTMVPKLRRDRYNK